MEQQLSEVMGKSQILQPTLAEILESYNHIKLSDDEVTAALIVAKKKKELLLEEDKKLKEEISRRAFLTQKTNYDLVKGLMMMRAKKIFGQREFIIDGSNEFVFELMCRYFGNDPEFVSLCLSIGVDNPSLDKGILLVGIFGTGKSWMIKLFQTNQRQCYEITEAKEIANWYKRLESEGNKNFTGEEVFKQYANVKKAAVDDPSVFYQTQVGLCIDDLGNEDVKNSYGNKRNVVAEILELRYQEKFYGCQFHATTNLTAAQIEQYYGGRVRSRLREMFNFIELPGTDRRK